MAQTSKDKPPAASTAAPGDEGKQSLNQSAPDFPRLVNMMAGSGFFQSWPGAMMFSFTITQTIPFGLIATPRALFPMDGPLPRRRTLRISNVDQYRKTPVSFCRLLSYRLVVWRCCSLSSSIDLDFLSHSLFWSLDHTAAGANPNDMFAVPSHLVGVKRAAGAVSPCFSNQTPIVRKLDLCTDIIIPLQQHEKKIKPGYFASCIQGASMTHAVAMLIQPSAGVSGNATAKNQDNLMLAHIDTSIQDGPNRECVLRYIEVWAEAFHNFK